MFNSWLKVKEMRHDTGDRNNSLMALENDVIS